MTHRLIQELETALSERATMLLDPETFTKQKGNSCGDVLLRCLQASGALIESHREELGLLRSEDQIRAERQQMYSRLSTA